MYGAALTADGQLQPIAATWARALAKFSPDDLARGLNACMTRTDGWPPTLPEFFGLCKAPVKLAMHRDLPALPKPSEQARAVGRRELAKLRERLGLKAPEEVAQCLG